jgi:hypothetical protein
MVNARTESPGGAYQQSRLKRHRRDLLLPNHPSQQHLAILAPSEIPIRIEGLFEDHMEELFIIQVGGGELTPGTVGSLEYAIASGATIIMFLGVASASEIVAEIAQLRRRVCSLLTLSVGIGQHVKNESVQVKGAIYVPEWNSLLRDVELMD